MKKILLLIFTFLVIASLIFFSCCINDDNKKNGDEVTWRGGNNEITRDKKYEEILKKMNKSQDETTNTTKKTTTIRVTTTITTMILPVCSFGELKCVGNDRYYCNNNGQWTYMDTCPAGTSCVEIDRYHLNCVGISTTTTTIGKSSKNITSNKTERKEEEVFKAKISKLSMSYVIKEIWGTTKEYAKFEIKVTNNGRVTYNEDIKLKLNISRQKGYTTCEDCPTKIVPVYVETEVFKKSLEGLNPRESKEFEFMYEPEIYSTYIYFAEILHENNTLYKTKEQYFEYKKI